MFLSMFLIRYMSIVKCGIVDRVHIYNFNDKKKEELFNDILVELIKSLLWTYVV